MRNVLLAALIVASLIGGEAADIICNPNPCRGNAPCITEGGGNKSRCDCGGKAFGDLCELNNPCASSNSICLNGDCIITKKDIATQRIETRCSCDPGWIGESCQTRDRGSACNFDENRNDPCNGSPCKNLNKVNLAIIECDCMFGRRGKYCNVTDNCATMKCNFEGTKECFSPEPEADDYTCICQPGFAGPHCEKNVNECSRQPNLCGTGTCVDTIGSYSCRCPPDRTGARCEQEFVPCESRSSCYNGGACTKVSGSKLGFTCQCPMGFTGKRCETDIDDCLNVSCGRGVCIDGVNSYHCQCDEQFEGPTCTKDVDECALKNPCVNSGICKNTHGGYRCTCQGGFEGKHCETNINECDPNPCNNQGTCIDGIAKYHCVCATGFLGRTCQLRDMCVVQCDSNGCNSPCRNGTCVNDASTGEISCRCARGFTGTHCEIDVNECADEPADNPVCSHGGKCVNVPGGFRCDCKAGYTGNRCDEDINECEEMPCMNQGTCIDIRNDFKCICLAGYSGKRCENQIDDCVNKRPCQNDGFCYPVLQPLGRQSFGCLCKHGFKGELCEQIEDPCLSSPCHNGGTCIRSHSNLADFTCKCPSPYTGATCITNNATVLQHWTDCSAYVYRDTRKHCSQVFRDGICDRHCDTPECLLDGGDCRDSPACPAAMRQQCDAVFNNQICNEDCHTAACGFDGSDCDEAGSALSGEIYLKLELSRSEFDLVSTYIFRNISIILGASVTLANDENGNPKIETWIEDNVVVGTICYAKVNPGKCLEDCIGSVQEAARFLTVSSEKDPRSFLAAPVAVGAVPIVESPVRATVREWLIFVVIAGIIVTAIAFCCIFVLYRKRIKAITWFPAGFKESQEVPQAGGGTLKRSGSVLSSGAPEQKRGRSSPSRMQEVEISSNLTRNLAMLESSLDPGALREPQGLTPLMLAAACRQGGAATVHQLVMECGATVDAQSIERGETALMLAARHANSPAVVVLLTLGADPTRKDKDGRTALHLAVGADCVESVRALLSHRHVDVDVSAGDGCTPLMLAARMHLTQVLLVLMRASPRPDAADDGGRTALHWSASTGNHLAAKILLEHGADRDSQTAREETATWLAAREGHVHLVKLLLEHGAQRDLPDALDVTPKEVAAGRGHKEVVAVLEQPLAPPSYEHATCLRRLSYAHQPLVPPPHYLGKYQQQQLQHQQQLTVSSVSETPGPSGGVEGWQQLHPTIPDSYLTPSPESSSSPDCVYF